MAVHIKGKASVHFPYLSEIKLKYCYCYYTCNLSRNIKDNYFKQKWWWWFIDPCWSSTYTLTYFFKNQNNYIQDFPWAVTVSPCSPASCQEPEGGVCWWWTVWRHLLPHSALFSNPNPKVIPGESGNQRIHIKSSTKQRPIYIQHNISLKSLR